MTIKNSILIKNSLKSGQNDLMKTIELLDKLGILKPKRKSAPRKQKKREEEEFDDVNGGEGGGGGGGGGGGSMPLVLPQSDRFPQTRTPNLITDIDTRNINKPQIGDVDRNQSQLLGLVEDRLGALENQYYSGLLGKRFEQSVKIEEIPNEEKKFDPFKKNIDYTQPETDEADNELSNQGSANIPPGVLNIDLSKAGAGFVNDDIDEGIKTFPEEEKQEVKPKAKPKAKPKVKEVNPEDAVMQHYGLGNKFNDRANRPVLIKIYNTLSGIYKTLNEENGTNIKYMASINLDKYNNYDLSDFLREQLKREYLRLTNV